MASRFALQLLSAFVDEALDLPGQLNVEARIEHDPVLHAQVQILRHLRAAVRANAECYVAPDGLHARNRESRVFRATKVAHPARFGWRQWFDWRPLVSSLSLVTLTLWGLNLSRGGMHYCVVSDLPREQLVKFALTLVRGSDTL